MVHIAPALPFLLALLSPTSPFPPLGRIHHAVLENGLTVLLLEDHSTPLVSVAVMYKVGSRNEAAGTTGLAHYAEHMNFRATRAFPGSEITEAITRIGGRWNGYTWIDQTFYVETVPREALDRMLELEADRMSAALYDPDDFTKERTSVIAELHSYDDPASVLYDAVLAASFEIHPYRNNTIGWLSDVAAVTRDEAYRFYRRFYHPNNAVLVVVGDVVPEATLQQVKARFAPLPASGEPTEIRTIEPPQTGQRRVTVRRPGPHAEILLAFRAPALGDPDFPAMVLFDALLAGGKGFRFTRDYPSPADTPLKRATVGRGLATAVKSDWQASCYPYVFTVSASVAAGASLPAAEEALFRALGEAREREWGEEEIAAALRQIATGWAMDHDDKPGRAHQLAFFEVAGGHRHLLEMPERLRTVTREELRRFARERLAPHRATVGWFVPETPEEGPRPEAARSPRASTETHKEAPPAAPPLASGASLTLANGLRVTLAPLPGVSLLTLRGRIEAGSLFDGERPGLSALATELLASPLTGEPPAAPAITWRLHEEPAAFSSFRWIEFGASCLPPDLPPLLTVLAGRLDRAAGADIAGWERLREGASRRARELAGSTETALWRRALAEMYPPGSPLARPAWGDEDGLKTEGLETFREFLRKAVLPSRTRLVVAGAVNAAAPGEVRDILGRVASRGGTKADPPLPSPRGASTFREIALSRPEKAQNTLMVVWPGDRSRAWDRPAIEALLYLLGETGYAGRLGRALVDPGLVYSVYTSLHEDGAPGFLAIRTAASPRDTPETLRRIRSILEETARGRFTGEELEEAKAYLRGKAARSKEGSVAAATTLLTRSGDAEAARLTLDQLNDTARRLFIRGAPVALVSGPGY